MVGSVGTHPRVLGEQVNSSPEKKGWEHYAERTTKRQAVAVVVVSVVDSHHYQKKHCSAVSKD